MQDVVAGAPRRRPDERHCVGLFCLAEVCPRLSMEPRAWEIVSLGPTRPNAIAHPSRLPSLCAVRNETMPVLTFLAVVGLALVALLFVADANLENVTPIVTSQQSGLPKQPQSDRIKPITYTPAPEPDMKSEAVLAAQPKSAPDETKIHPAARAARAEASPHRGWHSFRQPKQFDRFSIKAY